MTLTVRQAVPADDDGLRLLAAEAAMDDRGPLSLGYGREPSYLGALAVEGTTVQVPVFIDETQGRIVASCTRALRPVFVNGEPAVAGYLGGARLLPSHRGGTVLVRGYRELRRLHEDGVARLYVSTILEGNHQARTLLTSGRAGLPAYHDHGRYVCHTLLVRKRPTAASESSLLSSSLSFSSPTPSDLPAILACLERHGRRRQFAPRWTAEDLVPGTPQTRGLSLDDLVVLRRGGAVVGTGALWDQRSFKQTTVQRYGLGLRALRAVWNAAMPHLGYGPLPAQGSQVPLAFGALIAVDDDDPTVMREVIRVLLERCADRGILGLVVGLHEDDPLTAGLSDFWSIRYTSRFYVVCWDDGEAEHTALDGRFPFVEAGTL